MFDLEAELKKLPDKPGVYLMHDKEDHIIYVGKAVVLKNRVRQYFQKSRNVSPKIARMIEQIAWFEYIVTDSELEALVLECNLIKEHRPKYNTMLRDDKTYPYIKVTLGEAFPRVLFARRLKKDKSRYFGPYTSAAAVKDTIDLINKLYQLRTCSKNLPKECGNDRACLNYHIKQCLAPCQGNITQEEYHERVKKALDFLIKNSGNRVNLEVDFFGGEPLMNWQVVKELVEYGRSKEEEFHKKFRFTLTTNGILLDEEIMEFLNKEMANLVLSIDGRKHVHDAMRPLRGGQGSYEKIVSKFLKAAISREQKNYYVRGTYTRHNLDFSKDVLHLADLGFGQISVEPVVADEGEGYALKEEDIPTLFQEYDVLAKEMIKRERQGRGFHFFHFMLDLEGGPCVAKRLSGCGSGTEYLAVTPWGDLYPCHQFVGQEEYLMGNVEEGIFKTDIVEEFKGCSVYSKEKCRNCFAKFYCSGGCAANSKRFHETIHEVYDIGCQLQRKRVECAIMIKAAMEEEGNGKYD